MLIALYIFFCYTVYVVNMKRIYNKDVFKYFAISRLMLLLGILMYCLLSSTNIMEIYSYFDNEWYIDIAKNGYSDISVVFFPMIPLIIRYFGIIGCVIINLITSYLAGLLIYKLSNLKGSILWFFSPIAIFSILLYTESIFIFLTILTLYLYKNKKYLLAGITLGLSVLTRNMGSMLFFSIFIYMFYYFIKKKIKFKDILIMYIPATIISLIYPIYLQVKFNNWHIFVDSQYTYWDRISGNIFSIISDDINFMITSTNFFDKFYIIVNFIFLGLMIYFIYKDIRSNKKFTINSIYMILSILAIYSSARSGYNIPSTSFYRYFLGCYPIYLIGSSKDISKNVYNTIFGLFYIFFIICCILFISNNFFC